MLVGGGSMGRSHRARGCGSVFQDGRCGDVTGSPCRESTPPGSAGKTLETPGHLTEGTEAPREPATARGHTASWHRASPLLGLGHLAAEPQPPLLAVARLRGSRCPRAEAAAAAEAAPSPDSTTRLVLSASRAPGWAPLRPRTSSSPYGLLMPYWSRAQGLSSQWKQRPGLARAVVLP